MSTQQNPRIFLLKDIAWRLKNLLNDCFSNDPANKSLAQTLTKWTEDSLKRDWIANFYVIWKLNKKANAQGVRSPPISNNIGYPTGQVFHFLHSQFIDAVNAHVYVLKDSLSLIRQLEALSFLPKQNILLTSADVAAPILQLILKTAWRHCSGSWQNTPAYLRICSRNTSSSLD